MRRLATAQTHDAIPNEGWGFHMTEVAPAGWYPNPEDPRQQRYWDGAAWTQNVAPASPSEDAPQDLASPDNAPQPVEAPVLVTWKTSVGFSIFGLLGGPAVFLIIWGAVALVTALFGDLAGLDRQYIYPLIAFFTTAVVCALGVAYAAKFYPSYFGERPMLRSSKPISLCNLAFGGPIFGPLWNRNLTKRTKGVSHIVLIVLLALWLLGVASNVVTSFAAGPFPALRGEQASEGTFSTYTRGDGSFSVLVPREPEVSTAPLLREDGSKYYWTKINAVTSSSQTVVHYLDSQGFSFDEEDLVSEANRFIEADSIDADSTRVVRGYRQGFPSVSAVFGAKNGRYSSFTGILKDGDIYLMCGYGQSSNVAEELNASFTLSTSEQ